jgi:hypothetical protein
MVNGVGEVVSLSAADNSRRPQGYRSAHPYGRLSHEGRTLAKEHTYGTAYTR